MFSLPKNSEINIEIPIETLYTNLQFHPSRKGAMARKIAKMTIKNQIPCIMETEDGVENTNIFFIELILDKLDPNSNDDEIYDYITYKEPMLADMIDKMGQEVFYIMCDNEGNCREALFRKFSHLEHEKINNELIIDIDLNENDFDKIYNGIIEQIRDYQYVIEDEDV